MASDLRPGYERVFVAAGVGGRVSGRWSDFQSTHPSLEGWLSAGLLQRAGPHGEPAPDRLARLLRLEGLNVPVVVNMISDGALNAVVAASPGWRALGLRAWQRSVALCPVGHDDDGSIGPPTPTGALRASMHVRFTFGGDPRIEVGSKRTVGEADLALLALVELGTPPHAIDPKTPDGILVFRSRTRQLVFAKHVDHPGTKPNKFVERAFQQVVHESIGVGALVAL